LLQRNPFVADYGTIIAMVTVNAIPIRGTTLSHVLFFTGNGRLIMSLFPVLSDLRKLTRPHLGQTQSFY
jgi:hypothetical protein